MGYDIIVDAAITKSLSSTHPGTNTLTRTHTHAHSHSLSHTIVNMYVRGVGKYSHSSCSTKIV